MKNKKTFSIFLSFFILASACAFAEQTPSENKPSAQNAEPQAEQAAPSQDTYSQTPKLEALSPDFYKIFLAAAWNEQQGNLKEAYAFYKQVDEALPKDVTITSSLFNLSLVLEDKEGAVKYAEILGEIDAGSARTLSAQASSLWAQGKLEEAVKVFQKALAKNMEGDDIFLKYISLLSNINKDRALAELEKYSKQNPNISAMTAMQIGGFYMMGRDYGSAAKYYKEASEIIPQDPAPFYNLAKIYEIMGRQDDALKVYLEMERRGMADAEIYTKIGAYYVLNKDEENSTKYFLKAKELDAGQPSACKFLSLQAQERGDWQTAEQYLRESQTCSEEAACQVKISYFLNRQGKYEEASQTLKSAYEQFNNSEVGFYYALSLVDLRDYKGAQKVFERILARSKGTETILFNYALVLERLKEYKKMSKVLEDIIILSPKNAQALNFLGYYLVDKTKDVKRGGELIKKAVALQPEEYAFIDSLAWYYYKTKRYEEADNLLASIMPQAQKDAEVLLHAALAQEAVSKYKEAGTNFEAVLKLEPENKAAKKGLKRVQKKLK